MPGHLATAGLPILDVAKASGRQYTSSLTENTMACNNPKLMTTDRLEAVTQALTAEPQSSTHPTPSVENLGSAYDLLQQLLRTNGGVISNVQFKRDIISKLKLPEDLSTQCVKVLQFLGETEAEQRVGRKGAKTHYCSASRNSGRKTL